MYIIQWKSVRIYNCWTFYKIKRRMWDSRGKNEKNINMTLETDNIINEPLTNRQK